MHLRVSFCLLAFAATFARAQLPVSALPPDVLRPAGPWKVEIDPDECRLFRKFGTGDSEIVLRLARGSGFQQFDLVIAGKAIPRLKPQFSADFRLVAQSEVSSFRAYSMQVPNRPERFIRWYDGDAAILKAVTNSQVVELKVGNEFRTSLLLSGGRNAIDALNKCYEDLLTSWGVDPSLERLAKHAPMPTGNPGMWATDADYPADARRAGKSGLVQFLLTVDIQGKVRNCKVIHSSGVPSLDEKTCSLMMQRAQFKPAHDEQGNPVAGSFINRMRWVLPR